MWGALALAGLFLAAAGGSARFYCYATWGHLMAVAAGGRAEISWFTTAHWGPLHCEWGRHQGSYRWWFGWYDGAAMLPTARVRGAHIPFWFLAALSGGVAAGLWRGGRRSCPGSGVCGRCGYDLAGLGAGAVCPECGAGAAEAQSSKFTAQRSK